MPIPILNDVSDNLRVLNNLLAGMFIRPALKGSEELTPMRILIVDDVPDNIHVLSRMLAGEGIQVSTATSGRRALKLAGLYPPDLVLLDVMMPDMDGYEVCKAMKSDPLLRGVPVIFITALADEASEVRALEMGAVDFIIKPFKEAIVKLRIKMHLELKLQREVLENLTRLDGLTGIANRRAFDERLDLEWRRATRSRENLALAMIDVDYFKAYNDSNGHLAGDDCLRRIAAALHDSLNRAGDFVARFGGEEFAVLLPATGQGELSVIAGRMRQTVEALMIPHCASGISPWVTVSIGGASFEPDQAVAFTRIVELADRQLYLAKAQGRNQACLTLD